MTEDVQTVAEDNPEGETQSTFWHLETQGLINSFKLVLEFHEKI